MNVLEKILEEIEQRKARAEKLIVKPPHDKLDQVANDTAEAFIEAYKECQDIIRKHMNDGWIPIEEKLPEDNNYILLSFSNYTLPAIGRYEEDSVGGAFYLGDEDQGCTRIGLFVNAWQPLPEAYCPERMSND